MLWVLKRTVSMRRFFWATKTNVKTDGLENIYFFTLIFFCLSKPVITCLATSLLHKKKTITFLRLCTYHICHHMYLRGKYRFKQNSKFITFVYLKLSSCSAFSLVIDTVCACVVLSAPIVNVLFLLHVILIMIKKIVPNLLNSLLNLEHAKMFSYVTPQLQIRKG